MSNSSGESDSSDTFEYINDFAINNLRSSVTGKPSKRSRSASGQSIDLYDVEKTQYYPKPVTRKNIYSILAFAAGVWCLALFVYGQLPVDHRDINSYKSYNTTKAFGIVNNATTEHKISNTIASPAVAESSASTSASATALSGDHLKRFTLSDYRSGKFFAFTKSYNFVTSRAGKKDEGVYVKRQGLVYKAGKLSEKDFSKELVSDVVKYQNDVFQVSSVDVNDDLSFALVYTESKAQWRHSKFSQIFLYNIESKSLEPLHKDSNGDIAVLSFAQWSPKYNYVTFVYENDVYVYDLAAKTTTRVTNDGGENVFNGKPDWVYEEEVISTDRVIFWSPDESNFVFLKTNDTAVPEYEIDYYTKSNDKYPTHRPIKYPKPGYANPVMSIVNYNVAKNVSVAIEHSDKQGQQLGNDYIVYNVFWLNDDEFIIKETDRESKLLHYRKFSEQSGTSEIVREVNAVKEYNGWIDTSHSIAVPKNDVREKDGYVELAVDKNGFLHMAYFESDSKKPQFWLTSGDFDDKDTHMAYDSTIDIIYFTSATQSSMSSHVYKFEMKDKKLSALTKDDELGYYEPEFSCHGKFMNLRYMGPRLPWNKVIDLEQEHSKYFTDVETIDAGKKIKAYAEEYLIPTKQYTEIVVDAKKNISVNVIEIKPQNFDASKKYPLVVNFYAGPGSQRTQAQYSMGFLEVLASSLDAIVLVIDPRGTDSKGWGFKSYARDNIGNYEPKDILEATKQYMKKPENAVDAEQTVCWGWSYSGFVTLKMLEVDDEQVFKYGAAVAPVTDWNFYDSIYTERYIGQPKTNAKVYQKATVGSDNINNFAEKKRFLVMHGTGDDNVHIQNTYTFLDKLNLAGIENFDMKIFPDSDHSIFYHNANTIVYDKLYKWIKDAFDGKLAQLSN